MPDPPDGAAATLVVDKPSLGFSAAHFGILPQGRERLHGHNYGVALRASGRVGEDGTVVDFAALKDALGEECRLLDHRVLVPLMSPQVAVSSSDDGNVVLRVGDDGFSFPAADVQLLAVRNTTCECLAAYLLGRLRSRLGGLDVRLELGVEESPGQGASVGEA